MAQIDGLVTGAILARLLPWIQPEAAVNMPATKWMKNAAWPVWLLVTAAVLALGGTQSLAGPVPMQVEEPKTVGAQPPIQPEKDQAGWKSRKNASLTASQKAALKARQDTMKDMMAMIQQKRRAIREAHPEQRQALAQELHELILEQTQGADRTRSRSADRKAAKPAGESELEAKARTRDESLDQQEDLLKKKEDGVRQKEENLRQQETIRQQVEDKLKQLEAKAGSAGKRDED